MTRRGTRPPLFRKRQFLSERAGSFMQEIDSIGVVEVSGNVLREIDLPDETSLGG
jgi:hypothetical protein